MANKEIIKQKETAVNELTDKIKKAKSVVLIDYRGIKVSEDSEMRVNLRKENVEYAVIKNALLTRAFKNAGYDFDDVLAGPTAVAFGYEDAVIPAKIINDSAKKFNKLKFKGGVVENKKLNDAEMKAVALMPSKVQLIGQLLGMLTHPMRSLAVVLSEIAKKKAQ
ncbi:MAG: 50S ribosomal protein L10 [Firmicutes bacterium]|nr:50S ribosomal protein L10 [Bacillota bacterium]